MPADWIQKPEPPKHLKQKQLKVVVIVVSLFIFFGWLYWVVDGNLIGGEQVFESSLWQEMKVSSEQVAESYGVLKQRAEEEYSQVQAKQSQEEQIIEKMKEKISGQEEMATTTTTTAATTTDLNNNSEEDAQEASE